MDKKVVMEHQINDILITQIGVGQDGMVHQQTQDDQNIHLTGLAKDGTILQIAERLLIRDEVVRKQREKGMEGMRIVEM